MFLSDFFFYEVRDVGQESFSWVRCEGVVGGKEAGSFLSSNGSGADELGKGSSLADAVSSDYRYWGFFAD